MVGRDGTMGHPAGGLLQENFRQDNASALWVASRSPYKCLEGVLKWDTLLERTAQRVQVKVMPPQCGNTSPSPTDCLNPAQGEVKGGESEEEKRRETAAAVQNKAQFFWNSFFSISSTFTSAREQGKQRRKEGRRLTAAKP